MKRASYMILAVALLAAPAVVAQGNGQPRGTQVRRTQIERQPSPSGPTDLQILTGRANGQTYQTAPQPAPVSDEPSGPTDLDILTGKADRESREGNRSYYTPYVYGAGAGYGYRSRFGYGQFSGGRRVSSLPFRAAFGRARNHSFFAFGTGRSSFFFSQRFAGHSRFFFVF